VSSQGTVSQQANPFVQQTHQVQGAASNGAGNTAHPVNSFYQVTHPTANAASSTQTIHAQATPASQTQAVSTPTVVHHSESVNASQNNPFTQQSQSNSSSAPTFNNRSAGFIPQSNPVTQAQSQPTSTQGNNPGGGNHNGGSWGNHNNQQNH
jgi:hypothetical protein